jgi:hypothetical protein
MKYIPIIVTGLLTAIAMVCSLILELNGHAVRDQIVITVFFGFITGIIACISGDGEK